jgi:2-oxoisovalerate dehydrogenase E1 component
MDAKTLESALLIRRTEEALLRLYGEGKIHGTVHTCVGQELTGPCLAPQLTPEDTVFSTHRGHGHYLALTDDLDGLLGEIFGRASGAVGGAGGSQHLRRGNFFTSGIQGGIVPLAAGAAWAHQRDGKGRIAVAFLGDGTLGEGALYEAMNIAANWKLPLLLVLEDNQYAQSTRSADLFAGNVRARAEGFGFAYGPADTWNPGRLAEAFAGAVTALRAGAGPRLLHVATYRLSPHSARDDQRDPGELRRYRERDPLERLLTAGNPEALAADARAQARLGAALEAAQRASPPSPREAAARRRAWAPLALAGEDDYRSRLNAAFGAALAKDPDLLLLGEDLEDPYGGCFRVTAGLSTKFPGRVRNTPISEAAVAGLATGAAIAGKTAVAEFMFGDFTLLAMDQIVNHAAKFHELYPGLRPRVRFRTAMGGGRGYGATHSQSLEKHFLGVPGLEVFSLNPFVSPEDLLSRLETLGPSLVAEHKLLYREPAVRELPPPWRALRDPETLDTWLEPGEAPPAVVLVGHGAFVPVLWRAAQALLLEHEIPAAVLAFARLSGYDCRPDLARWRASPARIAFEEGQGYASFAAELGAQLGEHGLALRRWQPPAAAIPSAPALEAEFRLTPEKVVAEVMEALA